MQCLKREEKKTLSSFWCVAALTIKSAREKAIVVHFGLAFSSVYLFFHHSVLSVEHLKHWHYQTSRLSGARHEKTSIVPMPLLLLQLPLLLDSKLLRQKIEAQSIENASYSGASTYSGNAVGSAPKLNDWAVGPHWKWWQWNWFEESSGTQIKRTPFL